MDTYELIEFAQQFEGQVFYVGFLKGQMGWFPLARVSAGDELDTLIVSRDHEKMTRMCERAAKSLKNVEAFEVSELFTGQVYNRAVRYGLSKVEVMD